MTDTDVVTDKGVDAYTLKKRLKIKASDNGVVTDTDVVTDKGVDAYTLKKRLKTKKSQLRL